MKTIIITIIAAAVTFSAAAQSLTLGDAIRTGLENNYSIRVEKKNVESAGIRNSWGNTSLAPRLALNVNQNNSWQDGDVQIERSHSLSPGVSLNWVLFDGLGAFIQKNKLEEYEKQASGNFNVVVENGLQIIIRSYYAVVLEAERLKVFQEQMQLSEDQYKRAEKAKERGTTTTYQFLQLRDAWLIDKSNYLQQNTVYRNSIRSLNYQLGIKEDRQYNQLDEFIKPNEEYDIANLLGKLKSNNNTLKTQYISLVLAQQDVKAARAAYSPTLSMNAGYNFNNTNSQMVGMDMANAQSTGATLGFSLSMPIYQGGVRSRQLQLAKVQADMSQIRIEDMEHSLTNQLMQLLDTYKLRKELLKWAEDRQATAKTNLVMSQKKFESGAINSFDYRAVRNSYLSASNDYLNSKYNLTDSWVALLKITGGIIDQQY